MAPSEFLPSCEGTDVENKGLVPFKAVIFFKVEFWRFKGATRQNHETTFVYLCHVNDWNMLELLLNHDTTEPKHFNTFVG